MDKVSTTGAAVITPTVAATIQPAKSPIFRIGEDGWCVPVTGRTSSVAHLHSPNCDARPVDSGIALLVIHNISLPPGQFGGPFIADLFCNRLDYDADPYFDHLRPLRVSAHFLIRRDGSVVQFVSTNQRAWHAGVSSFDERQGCNDFSIGIELEGTDFESFAAPQYPALCALTDALMCRHGLVAVRGHSHIAPGRKSDPGPFFDWHQYQQGLADYQPQVLTNLTLRFPIGD
ncbi:1,6-anhydro-N-acetylmuramyl-L-alanine amidase AmpD [Glaciimonas sp. PAMC28666]|uniref:1,6-anhydro-N-acetylmuramyl-L-alanine amidase AmpD n=1 Tax=Glaciimonas sp. PAMC28666 TaxID=2807626 RepID=UPI0019665F79|nr:1,6-anhydro-N-acetylmuramyl-L-alanine amidase AmpD [Glaciimonas sp. PAMC28666]QRX84590.1 1,6-anhydro-N-acetylmuramyl-L-alanine amidase AmpD [Glaciimonas sp. PAMC28666]